MGVGGRDGHRFAKQAKPSTAMNVRPCPEKGVLDTVWSSPCTRALVHCKALGRRVGNAREPAEQEVLHLCPAPAEPRGGAPPFPTRSSLLGSAQWFPPPQVAPVALETGIRHFRPTNLRSNTPKTGSFHHPYPKTYFAQTSLGNRDGWASLFILANLLYLNF